jgi:hypothetical protein
MLMLMAAGAERYQIFRFIFTTVLSPRYVMHMQVLVRTATHATIPIAAADDLSHCRPRPSLPVGFALNYMSFPGGQVIKLHAATYAPHENPRKSSLRSLSGF